MDPFTAAILGEIGKRVARKVMDDPEGTKKAVADTAEAVTTAAKVATELVVETAANPGATLMLTVFCPPAGFGIQAFQALNKAKWECYHCGLTLDGIRQRKPSTSGCRHEAGQHLWGTPRNTHWQSGTADNHHVESVGIIWECYRCGVEGSGTATQKPDTHGCTHSVGHHSWGFPREAQAVVEFRAPSPEDAAPEADVAVTEVPTAESISEQNLGHDFELDAQELSACRHCGASWIGVTTFGWRCKGPRS